MSKIDDNTLAAYLEGTLLDEDREWVEHAIEEDEESQAVVDEWIAMADDFRVESTIEDNSDLRMEACRTIGAVMEQIKERSGSNMVAARAAMPAAERATGRVAAMPVYEERRAGAAKPVKRKVITLRRVLIAASLLAFVSVTGVWLLQSPAERSAPSFSVPMGGDYMACPPEDTIVADSAMQFNDYSGLYK